MNRLFRRVDAAPLAAFRILFGTLMVWDVFHYWKLYVPYFAEPHFHFLYVDFIKPWPPGDGIRIHLIVMGIAAAGVALGLLYRLSASVFFVAYAHFFLMDKSIYNNHYYLYTLLAFLLIFVDAHRIWSLDAARKPDTGTGQVPFWNIFLLRAQIVIVYFFGGVAKLNPDWLRGEPMRHWLANKSGFWLIGPFLSQEWAAFFFSYAGLAFDLSIGFLLLWKKTRWPAIILLTFFHLMNAWFFDIGIFPYVMLAVTVLFFEPDGPRRLIERFRVPSPRVPERPVGRTSRIVAAFMAIYLAAQIVIPLRHWFYRGNVDWTEEGHLFAWRMMLRDKQSRMRMAIQDPGTGEMKPVNFEDLNGDQKGMISGRPDMIWQYAQSLKRKLESTGLSHPIIRAQVQASLNFRPPKYLMDGEVNLADVKEPLLGHASWVTPDPESAPDVH